MIPKYPDYKERQQQAHLRMDSGERLSLEDHAALFHWYSEAVMEEGYPPQRHLYEKYRDYHEKKYREKWKP